MNSLMTINAPLVSVLVPVYNVERYLYEALNSIANQTYKNLQIIVVDDCSTDGTGSIVEAFCAKDCRFVSLRNERNLHIVKTLNKALEVASGEFIARCDGDDIMELDRIERQFNYLQQNPDVALVGCSLQTINEAGEPLSRFVFPSGTAVTRRLLKYSTAVSHIWLARREVYDVVGRYRMPTVEDYDFLLRADLAGFNLDNIPNYFGMRIRTRTDNTVGKYGIVQRKLFNYAKKVNRFERNGVKHFYADEMVSKIIETGKTGFLAKLHYLSDRCSYVASLNKNKFRKIPLMCIAAALSPYKFQYYLNTLIRSLIIKRHDA